MAYRSGTYVAFHAGGSSDPIASDIRYYRMLLAWHEHDGIEFRLINSHEKANVRDRSSRDQLRAVLRERLQNSRNMVLIVGQTTRFDTDWVPFEIEYAVDTCEIPIIATYPDEDFVLEPSGLSHLWPAALATRIRSGSAHVLHVPFKQALLNHAITTFDHDNYPVGGGESVYTRDAYASFAIRLP